MSQPLMSVFALQHLILHDFFELQMRKKYGNRWELVVANRCLEKPEEYRDAVRIINEQGKSMFTKDKMDVTFVKTMILREFFTESVPVNGEKDAFLKYIFAIKQNRNQIGHFAAYRNKIKEKKLELEQIDALSDFVSYLNNSNWKSNTVGGKDFCNHYSLELTKLANEALYNQSEEELFENNPFLAAFNHLDNEKTRQQGIRELLDLEKTNTESALLLSFFYAHGIYVQSDIKKAKSMLDMTEITSEIDCSKWLEYAIEKREKKEWEVSTVYYLAVAERTKDPNLYYEASSNLITGKKNRDLFMECLKISADLGNEKAKAIYQLAIKNKEWIKKKFEKSEG